MMKKARSSASCLSISADLRMAMKAAAATVFSSALCTERRRHYNQLILRKKLTKIENGVFDSFSRLIFLYLLSSTLQIKSFN